MAAYLLFTLAAPIASFGTVAVGERRPTWDRPSKSQIIGLVASCLGIERREEARQQALTTALGFAVRIDDPGRLTTDYHTTQVPQMRRNRRFATRAEELGAPSKDIKTILSRREYRLGSCYTICLWLKETAALSLDDIRAGLRTPAFTPFAGRKANALMLPMWAEVVDAHGIAAAFARFDACMPAGVVQLWRDLNFTPRGDGLIFADADQVTGLAVDRLEERRDIPESRSQWRFGLRAEALLRPDRTLGDAS